MDPVCISCRHPFTSSETHSLLWPCKHSIHEVCAKTLANCTLCSTPVEGLAIVTIKKIDPITDVTTSKANSVLSRLVDFVKEMVAEPPPENEMKWTVEAIFNAVTSFVQVAKKEGFPKIQVRFIGYLEAELLNKVAETFTNVGFNVVRTKETEFNIGKELLSDGEFQIGVRKATWVEGEHPVFKISFGDCQVRLVFSNVQYTL